MATEDLTIRRQTHRGRRRHASSSPTTTTELPCRYGRCIVQLGRPDREQAPAMIRSEARPVGAVA
jgi:hypothetical protein